MAMSPTPQATPARQPPPPPLARTRSWAPGTRAAGARPGSPAPASRGPRSPWGFGVAGLTPAASGIKQAPPALGQGTARDGTVRAPATGCLPGGLRGDQASRLPGVCCWETPRQPPPDAPTPPRRPRQTPILQPYLRGTSRHRTVAWGRKSGGGPDPVAARLPQPPCALALFGVPGSPHLRGSRMRARHAPTRAGKRACPRVGLGPSRRSRRASEPETVRADRGQAAAPVSARPVRRTGPGFPGLHGPRGRSLRGHRPASSHHCWKLRCSSSPLQPAPAPPARPARHPLPLSSPPGGPVELQSAPEHLTGLRVEGPPPWEGP
ncbi:atherin-like [Lontra canadensis]|uniref:atherin-like n=1 Tax=Lontra canadensis TaxID=76717 RepID=UPI0013F329F0|nr:atherin-like [Lontra canadensis]